MFTRRVLSAVSLLALVTLSLSTSAQPVRAGSTWNYPSDCATVQVCIDAASPGDTVFMFADAVGQNVVITKSVSLKSGNATKYRVNVVGYGDVATPVISTLAGISIDLHLSIFLNSTNGSSIIVRNVFVGGQAGLSTISVDVETSASVTIERSAAHHLGNSGDALSLLAVPNGGQIDFRVVGNRFDGHGNSTSGDGIALTTQSSGNLRADIYNNSIWDVARGGFAGIFLSASGTVHADVNVVGNTVEQSGADALQERNMLSSGGSFAFDLFNNTFSHAKVFGVRLDNGSAVPTSFRAGFNNYFANTSGNSRDGLSLGGNNLAVDPKFVNRAAGNLKLTSTSKLLNKGQACSVGGAANPDADGRHRVSGANTDMGAYERGAIVPNGLVILGTNGPETQTGTTGADLICGYDGNDRQFALGGNDFIDGGAANDFQVGYLGADRMLGGGGNDTLCADDGKPIDFLNGGKGTDRFKADSGDTRTSVEQPAGVACEP